MQKTFFVFIVAVKNWIYLGLSVIHIFSSLVTSDFLPNKIQAEIMNYFQSTTLPNNGVSTNEVIDLCGLLYY